MKVQEQLVAFITFIILSFVVVVYFRSLQLPDIQNVSYVTPQTQSIAIGKYMTVKLMTVTAYADDFRCVGKYFDHVTASGHEIKKGNLNGEIIDWGFDQYGPLGIGVRKGEARLLSMLNNVVATMFFDGTYINITESWFAVTGLNVAIDPSVETKTEIQTDFTTSTETRTETRTETDHTTSTIRTTDKSVVTTYDVITSTFIDSKAEVTYNLAIPSIIFSIVLYTYFIRKRRNN